MNLPDIQNQKGNYSFPVKAGVSKVKIPIHVKNYDGQLVHTIADVDISVRLPRQYKGINMSRLPIILNNMSRNNWVIDNLKPLLEETMQVMESDAAFVRMTFPYFFERKAPVTDNVGLLSCECVFSAVTTPDTYKFVLTVRVPVMTLCPCSKEISRYSAHNQRAMVEISVYTEEDFIWIEELLVVAEQNASSALYPILKRLDEKYVTEHSYNKPRFVEDLARLIAVDLEADPRIKQFHVSVSSQESIHQHDAVAEVEGGLTDLWSL